MANENGKSALQYLLEEVDGTVTSMEEQRPNFNECPVGKDFAEQQFRGTLLMLKMQRIYVRDSLSKTESETKAVTRRSRRNDDDEGGRSVSGEGSGGRGNRWGFIKIGSGANYIQASGVAAFALVLVYLILKVNHISIIP